MDRKNITLKIKKKNFLQKKWLLKPLRALFCIKKAWCKIPENFYPMRFCFLYKIVFSYKIRFITLSL
jgi:hypothetical protein